MPRVSIKKKDYKVTDFMRWLIGEMGVRGIRQKDIGEWLGISQPAVCNKMKKCEFSLKELITIFEKFGTSEEQIGKLLKV